jgi:5-methylcytosine-specific restriction endonuclease McrA
MTNRNPELTGRPRRRLVAQVRREEPDCWLCGYPINLALPATHPMSSTVDEVIPRSRAVDPYRAALTRSNCRHAHRTCNSARGNRLPAERPRHSRDW